ncbi:MAG TPA: hypothetical protein VNW50_06845 [Streptosporangiaceae bacterium]|jgi:hypothetical protein|nr:hypothetical protein [Streptosporangiaceae bacterium]
MADDPIDRTRLPIANRSATLSWCRQHPVRALAPVLTAVPGQ